MADHLPLLVFPQAKRVSPPVGNPFPVTKPHFPEHSRQISRLTPQLDLLQKDFSRYKASIGTIVAGLEPETVLVIEIAGTVENFRRAIEATDGLEWLAEWDSEDVESDNDFYYTHTKIGKEFFKNKVSTITTRAQSIEIRDVFKESGFIDDDGNIINQEVRNLVFPAHLIHLSSEIIEAVTNAKDKKLEVRLFLSFTNTGGMNEILSLWDKWKNERQLPRFKTKWRDVFAQIRRIRRWGIEETLKETGMINRWLYELEKSQTQEIYCQIELFYRQNIQKRQATEAAVVTLLDKIGGHTLGNFIDMPDIKFHAVKAMIPSEQVRLLLKKIDSSNLDIQLFNFSGIMYFRPTGQSVEVLENENYETQNFPEDSPKLPPVVAILDGVPNLKHDALKNRVLFVDPDNLESEYQPGEKRHGTAMASLIVHGELSNGVTNPLNRMIYHSAIMQPYAEGRTFNKLRECFPDDIFWEDRINRAVRRMFEGEGKTPAQAPDIKLINVSIGDPDRPFIHTPSPCARLLDWLSWKYKVLFCVSAGNYASDMDVYKSHREFSTMTDEKKIGHIIVCIEKQLSERRLLSPAESINALTIGAIHTDESGDYVLGQRANILPGNTLFSPISRLGHGFRRAIKPEIFFPGGRKLYNIPLIDSDTRYSFMESQGQPGQKVAFDSSQQGQTSPYVFLHGTSNATALATRAGARIYEVLAILQEQYAKEIPNNLIAVLIKSLLVHGAKHDDYAKKVITDSLKNQRNAKRFKEIVSRYVGYGTVDIERVLSCTEQRATILGCAEIEENQIHEYRFPLPPGLSGTNTWRRMIVTLAWFSPINTSHRNLREAKLEVQPANKWNETELVLSRIDSDGDQVLRGTVQHEILESSSQISAYQDDGHILLHVKCKKDATQKLDDAIPYGLVVTFEIAENIPIYQEIRDRVRPQVPVGVSS